MLPLYNKKIIIIGFEISEIQRVKEKIRKNTTFSCLILNN